AEVMDTVSLIDAIWLKPGTGDIVAAFEIEKTTSIYSGILRLEDLARSISGQACKLYLVAPNEREKEVMAQFLRPALRPGVESLSLAFIPFKELSENCEALCKFGNDHTIMQKIARSWSGASAAQEPPRAQAQPIAANTAIQIPDRL
ncbi:MAG TPA: hypothetical protein VF988_01700, partial [Verrucomicrobiae bacterium]